MLLLFYNEICGKKALWAPEFLHEGWMIPLAFLFPPPLCCNQLTLTDAEYMSKIAKAQTCELIVQRNMAYICKLRKYTVLRKLLGVNWHTAHSKWNTVRWTHHICMFKEFWNTKQWMHQWQWEKKLVSAVADGPRDARPNQLAGCVQRQTDRPNLTRLLFAAPARLL